MSSASSTAIPSTSKGKRNRKAQDYYEFEKSVCSVSDHESAPALKLPEKNNRVIKTVIQENARKPPSVETFFQLPIVSPPDPRVQHVVSTPLEEYDYAEYDR